MSIVFENPNTGMNEMKLHQWDRGILMHVDIQNTDHAEATFWQTGYKEALRKTLTWSGGDWTCVVPDKVLESGANVYTSIVYLDDGRNTVIGPISIPVIAQIKPAGYVSSDVPEYVDAIVLIQQIRNAIDESTEDLGALIDRANSSIKDVNGVIATVPPSYENLLDNLIVFSNIMPVSQYNRIWISGSDEVEIPTMEEFDALEQTINQLIENGVPDKDIATAVANYMKNHPPTGVDEEAVESIVNSSLSEITERIERLEYKPIEILSFNNSIGTAEIGSTVLNVRLIWEINKAPTSLLIDDIVVNSVQNGELLIESVSNDKTYTMKATDAKGVESSKMTSIKFYNRIIYGVSNSSLYDEALLNSLSNKVLSGTKARTMTVAANTGEFIFYAIPSRLGTPSFKVGGFEGGFEKVATIDHTNSSGYSENYDIWKSDNAGLGVTTITVS